MENSEVMITVTGSGELSDGNEITTKARGRYYVRNEKRYLLYELPDDNTPGLTIKHKLVLSRTSLEITKSAPGLITRILYQPGATTETDYATPYGNVVLSFKTETLETDENEEILVVTVCYEILSNGEPLSKNRLVITCTPAAISS